MTLAYKAWLESRFRFVIGLATVIAVCVLYIRLRPILLPGWIADLRAPGPGTPAWLPLGVRDPNFYAWHFLYENKLQQVWVLFAVLLSFGGLVREQEHGTVAFSLSLPVSRNRWLISRLFVAAAETTLLGVVAALVIPLVFRTNHEPYPWSQAIAHCALLIAAGAVFLALGTLSSTVLRGEHKPLIATLLVLGVPYLFLQEYLREAAPSTWVRTIDISHVMAGPPRLTWPGAPWVGLAVAMGVTIAVVALSARIANRSEY